MKNCKLYFMLLLLLGFASAYSQETKMIVPGNSKADQSLADPKLNPEEQALRIGAGENNPAKIEESMMTDPKIKPEDRPSEKDFGESNARPEGDLVDPKTEPGQAAKEKPDDPGVVGKAPAGKFQPEGEKTGTTPDYRIGDGTENQQVSGSIPEQIPDYREMNGPDEQPAGESPDK